MSKSPVKMWRRQKDISALVGKTGNILLATNVRIPPSGFAEMAPYAVGIIKLDNGEKMIGQIVDTTYEALKPGQKVRAVLRRLPTEDPEGIIHYAIKFVVTK